MNIRRQIARFVAGTAAISSLAVGFGLQPASAQNCETITSREVSIDNVSVLEGNPGSHWASYYTPLQFRVKTWGCLTASSLGYAIGPGYKYTPANSDDVANEGFTAGIHGTLAWAEGASDTKTITVWVRRDLVVEPTEALYFSVWPQSGNIVDHDTVYGFIEDDDGYNNIPK